MIPDWASERSAMVARQLRARGIRDPRVLRAMGEVPREEFVPDELRLLSYRDEPLMIGRGQTISQPFMTALMAECLELEGPETVLEVGAGSGYHAAVLGLLAKKAITVEIVPALAKLAERNLAKTGRLGNIRVVAGDGSAGCPEYAPFQAISVAAGAPDVPGALVDQLCEGGRLVIPVGPLSDQSLLVVTKRRGGNTETRTAGHCRFVPLRGEEGWR
ncbi:MAG: protein-L-isoaspartate(D-aspartate) O-methyltransferase [Acidobacteria bacterium]|nr:protein-L-isoaspartate(D-aspartate) O-methyltransferase [Acidobacteriota bacterium]